MPECPHCGRSFPQLYKLTADDIGREHPPPLGLDSACGECLDKVRSIARLIPERSFRQTVQDISWKAPVFSIILFTAALAASTVRGQGLGDARSFSQWLGIGTVLFGIIMVWEMSMNRYGFTHDLRWTVKSKRVSLAIAIVLAGILVSILSSQIFP